MAWLAGRTRGKQWEWAQWICCILRYREGPVDADLCRMKKNISAMTSKNTYIIYTHMDVSKINQPSINSEHLWKLTKMSSLDPTYCWMNNVHSILITSFCHHSVDPMRIHWIYVELCWKTGGNLNQLWNSERADKLNVYLVASVYAGPDLESTQTASMSLSPSREKYSIDCFEIV